MTNDKCRELTVAKTVDMLLSQPDWLILCHHYPDGDTLGSAFALCRALQATGRAARVLCADNIPDKYAYFTAEVSADEVSGEHICAVDVVDPKLLGKALEETYADRIDLCIDHHVSNLHYARHLLLKDYAATAMLVLEIIREMNVALDPVMAEALYTGIATDSGCFKYGNTTALTHRMAAELMDVGIRYETINREMFDIKSRARMELERMALSGIRFACNDRVALMPVTRAMIEQTNATEGDMEGLSPLPRQIEGVWIGVLLRERIAGGYKVSLRSDNRANVSAIAQKMGGGGHVAAAGCSLNLSLEDACERVLEAIRETVPEIERV